MNVSGKIPEISFTLHFGRSTKKLTEITFTARDFVMDERLGTVEYYREITKYMPNEEKLSSVAENMFFAVRDFMASIYGVIQKELAEDPGAKVYMHMGHGKYLRVADLSQLFLMNVAWGWE